MVFRRGKILISYCQIHLLSLLVVLMLVLFLLLFYLFSSCITSSLKCFSDHFLSPCLLKISMPCFEDRSRTLRALFNTLMIAELVQVKCLTLIAFDRGWNIQSYFQKPDQSALQSMCTPDFICFPRPCTRQMISLPFHFTSF